MNCPLWTVNKNTQDPCTVVQLVDNSCGYTYGSITPPSSESSFIPTGSNVTQCTCSWASYNLFSACMLCYHTQPSFVSWNTWIENCGDLTSTSYFPSGITLLANASMPYYSTINPSVYPSMTFSENIAADIANEAKPDVTGGPVPSSTSPSSGSSSNSSATPAIIGGIVGGVVLLLLFCGFFLFFLCRKRHYDGTLTTCNRSRFTVQATKVIVPSQLVAQMSASPYAGGMPGVPLATNLSSVRIASPTSQGHLVPVSFMPPSDLPTSPPITDAADVISPFLPQSPNPANTSRSEKNAQNTTESIPDRATSPQSQRSRMNPPPYTPTSPTSSHGRRGSSASRRFSMSRHLREGGGSGDTTIRSVIGNQKRRRTQRMPTDGSMDSTWSMATTASVGNNGAGQSIRTLLERTTTSADSSSRGPAV